MWEMIFVNQYGQTFTVNEEELHGQDILEYIQYCTEAKSILVSLTRI